MKTINQIIHTGLDIDPKVALELAVLFNEYSNKRFSLPKHDSIQLVYNDYDRQYQLVLLSEGFEQDIMGLLDNKLVPVLRCDWCDTKTNERFWVERDEYGSDQVCQGCYEQ